MVISRYTAVSAMQKRGSRYEKLAEQYLRRAGLRLLDRNYRARGGEIDLICRDGPTLVFVEVRFRRTSIHGLPVESVSAAKRRRLIHAATLYLQERRLLGQVPCRFDVIGVVLAEGVPVVHWVRHAFE